VNAAKVESRKYLSMNAPAIRVEPTGETSRRP
jgi:hypothetical protein